MRLHDGTNRCTPLALSRREALQVAGAHLLGVTFAQWTAASGRRLVAAEERSFAPLHRFPRMVQEYFVERVRAVERRAKNRREALATRADAEAYVRDARERIQSCFGPWPEKTPLEPRVTSVVERDGYRIENVIFESRPDFLVTANLYVPQGLEGPRPAVVGTCGHSQNGKAEAAYQSFAQGLARQGYVVLIYDPIGQGERLQYPDSELKSRVGVGVREHLQCGNQQFLVGEFIGAWRAWDGIRALDYLLTREEVDPRRVGVTGNSGGGTMTTWLCGVEDRWAVAAPSCFVTTFRRNTENELPADTEQCPPRALELGLDHSDFIAAMAPRPVILLAKEKDYFDVRGAEEAYRRLQRLYELLGAPENIGLFVGPTFHGYSQENREAMYGWFHRATGITAGSTEPTLVIEKDETLRCTPKGQVSELGSRSVPEFTRERSRRLARERPERIPLEELEGRVRRVLGLDAIPLPRGAATPPPYRILRRRRSRGYPRPNATTYAVETEPGILAVVYRLGDERLYSRPPRGARRAVLYVSHHSSDAELREEPLIKEIVARGGDESRSDGKNDEAVFYTCDVRGVGESQPDTCDEDSFLTPYGSDYFYAIHAIMLGSPYLGMKTFDVLRVLDWLEANGHETIHLVGKGWGALPATFAGLLHERVVEVTLKHALTSYAAIAEADTYGWPLSCLLPGVLESFDLPDCYAALEAKKLHQIEPRGAAG